MGNNTTEADSFEKKVGGEIPENKVGLETLGDITSVTIANFRKILDSIFSVKEIDGVKTDQVIYNTLNHYRLFPKEKQAVDIIIDTAIDKENAFVKKLKDNINSYFSLELSIGEIFFSNKKSEDTFSYAQKLKNVGNFDDSLKIFIFLNSNFPNESKYECGIMDIAIRLKGEEGLLFEIFKNDFSPSQIYEKIGDYYNTTSNPNSSIVFYKRVLEGVDKEEDYLRIITKLEKNNNPEITEWILSTLLQFFNKNPSSSKIAEKLGDIYNNRGEDKKALDYYLRAHALLKDDNIRRVKLAIKLGEVHYCTIVHLIKESKSYEFNDHFLSFLSIAQSYFKEVILSDNLISEIEKEKVIKSFDNVNLLIDPQTRERTINNLRGINTSRKMSVFKKKIF